MSHAYVSHVATVTATATVADNTVDLHVDVTHPYRQAPVVSSHPNSSHHQPPTPHQMAASASNTHPASYLSPGALQDSNSDGSSASMMPLFETTTMGNFSDTFYHSGYGGWYGGVDMMNTPYWQADFVMSNGMGSEEYDHYDSGDFNGLANVDGYSGGHFQQDNFDRRSNQWAGSVLDYQLCSPYSGWSGQEGGLHYEEGPHYCQYRELSSEVEKPTEEMRHSNCDLGDGKDSYALGESLEVVCAESQNFLTLDCSQAPGVSLPVMQQESSAQNNIFRVTDPFQENIECDPKWRETDIDEPEVQQTYTTSLYLPDVAGVRCDKEFHGENTGTQEERGNSNQNQVRPNNNKQSCKTRHEQNHGKVKSTIKNNSGVETPCFTGTKDANQGRNFHTPDSSCSLNGVPGSQETMFHRQQERLEMSSGGHPAPQSGPPQDHCSVTQQGNTSLCSTEKQSVDTQSFFFPRSRDTQYQTTQTNITPENKEPLSPTISPSDPTQPHLMISAGLPTSQTKPPVPVSSCETQCSGPKTTGSSPESTESSRQPPTHSPSTSSELSGQGAEGFCNAGSPASPSESSLSSLSSPSAQPLIDVDHLLSSGITVAGFKPRPIIRKRPKVMIPSTQKDSGYWDKRKKNNDSAKRSREAKKEKEKNFYRRALELEYENYFLKERLGQMEAQLHAVTGVGPGPPPLPNPPPVPPCLHSGAVPIAPSNYATGFTSAGQPCV